MSADVAIVSANLGNFDDVFPQAAQDIPVDFIYFTDEHGPEPKGWDVRRQSSNGVHPCLAAKTYKFLPPVSHRYVIWCDANICIESAHFAREALTFINDGIALHAHPFRTSIYQEAVETILTPKYDDLPIAEQVRHYRREGHPVVEGGLYACGVIAWDREGPKSRHLGHQWMAECQRWGFQDQLSAPIVMRRLGITPGLFPHNQYRSPWLRIFPHRR